MSKHRKASPFIGIDNGRELFFSSAWMKLSASAMKMYGIFLCKRSVTPVKGKKGKRWAVNNNGEIQFTLSEASRLLGKSRTTVLKAKDELVRYGFIDVAHTGGCLDGDCAKYAISNRWLKYGTPDFEEIIRPKDTRVRGFLKNPENRYKQNPGSENLTGAVQKT